MGELKEPTSSQCDTAVAIADDIIDALDRLDAAVAGLVHLVPTIAGFSAPVRTAHWPRPGLPKLLRNAGLDARPVPDFPPTCVLERWTFEGSTWLSIAPRLEVRATLVALATEDVGPRLASSPGFLTTLLERLRPRQKALALATALFRTHPPPVSVLDALRRAPQPRRPPVWWSERAAVKSIELALGVAVVAGDLVRPGDLQIPGVAWRSGWATAIVSVRRPRSVPDIRAQLCFALAGNEPNPGVMPTAVIVALKRGIAFASRRAQHRREVAIIARNHVGSPFGADAEARWRPLGDALRKVRQWLAGEVLAIVFQHLVPPNRITARQTEPRREFWSKYTGSVRRIWVAVTRSIRPQLRHPDVRRLQETMGEDLVICELKGGPEQAVVWMQLDGSRGPVTVVEGNANTSIRIRRGAFQPRRTLVHYARDITGGDFQERQAHRFSHDQWGRWKEAAARVLSRHGIRRDLS